MSVYVDRAAHPHRGMVMCHMIADTPGELRRMADHLGLDVAWFQADASMPHFDISKTKRELALKLGAIALGRREYVLKMRVIRVSWPRDNGRWLLAH